MLFNEAVFATEDMSLERTTTYKVTKSRKSRSPSRNLIASLSARQYVYFVLKSK